MKLYTGSAAGPVTVRGVNCIRLAGFALFFQGWHSYATDRATRAAVSRLEALKILEVNRDTRQFRWHDTRAEVSDKR